MVQKKRRGQRPEVENLTVRGQRGRPFKHVDLLPLAEENRRLRSGEKGRENMKSNVM